jgi:hypothetical protein
VVLGAETGPLSRAVARSCYLPTPSTPNYCSNSSNNSNRCILLPLHPLCRVTKTSSNNSSSNISVRELIIHSSSSRTPLQYPWGRTAHTHPLAATGTVAAHCMAPCTITLPTVAAEVIRCIPLDWSKVQE